VANHVGNYATMQRAICADKQHADLALLETVHHGSQLARDIKAQC